MTGNTGNIGNTAGAGNATIPSGGWYFPDRADLPFVTERINGQPIATLLQAPTIYADRNWSADFFSWRVLVEFSGSVDWQNIQLRHWSQTEGYKSDADEIQQLAIAASTERLDALGEILSQAAEFISHFMNLMTAQPTAYPATLRVLNAASLVALFMQMRWKAHYKRPRPTHLCPALMPPIVAPGHASYPSGHATQSHLMALCMADVFDLLPEPRKTQMAATGTDLWVLADRIARNRELAGVHYPSDSRGGVELAQAIHPHLKNMASDSSYQTAVASAVQEWTW